MKALVTTALLATCFLVGESAFGAQVSIGIQIGPPPPPRVVYVTPVRPAPEFVWVGGYWYPEGKGKHYKWREGYWVRPPYAQALWVVPHYSEGRYFEGYWVDKSKDHDKEKKSNGRGRGHDK